MREVLTFTALTYALALLIAVALPHANLNLLLTTLAPATAVAILTFTMFPRGTRRELWRGFGLHRSGARTWGAALGVPLVLCAGAFGTALLLGAGRLRPLHLTGFTAGDFVLTTAVNLLSALVFLASEEIGFRGFVLPRLQQLTGKRRAALVSGFAHALMHLPLILVATTYDAVGPRWVAATVAVLTITAAGIFYAWLWDRSASVWAPAVGHTVANSTFEAGFAAVVTTTPTSLALVAGETGFATLGVVVIAAVVLLRWARVWRPAFLDASATGGGHAPLTAPAA
ncbi:CPBP family intramembrane glutamic endopeptidase [Kineococcus sp. SYSU DK001]|uniref:CPBP family intramembrane glutamic endopeptidase n=1 Tax=Kineococcus sp. SYSU DK001 TaxID=3383122 RepID=UPI003D7D66CA